MVTHYAPGDRSIAVIKEFFPSLLRIDSGDSPIQHHRFSIHYHCIQHSEAKMPSAKSQPAPAPAAKPARLTRAQRTAILKALSDPKRFELLENIARAQCPLTCTMAHEALAISPATLSHHIKELQTSGLIDVRREGKFAFLSIKPGVLEAISSYLQSLSPASCPTR
jgi:ArsR family transcriptional regulator, arsenate/arsenite/antimonite-responsive transcriptional repressor